MSHSSTPGVTPPRRARTTGAGETAAGTSTALHRQVARGTDLHALACGAVFPGHRDGATVRRMCRNIHVLHNFEPPATDDEVRAAARQYVAKVSGASRPSQANAAAFERAVDAVAHATEHLLSELVTSAPPKDREVEAAKARERAALRYAR